MEFINRLKEANHGLKLATHLKRFSSKMQHRLLDETADVHSVKSWCLNVDKKKIAIASATAIVVTTAVILIVVFASSAPTEDEVDPPGTALPRQCGRRTDESNFPWTVEIYVRDGPDDDWEHTIAQGTLVNDRYVLSSAYELRRHKRNDLRVLLGEVYIENMVDDAYFENRVYREIVRKEFVEYDEEIDIQINMVLLRMDKAVRFNGRMQPICLPWVHPETPQQLIILPDHKHKLFSSSAYLVDYQECFKIWYYHEFDLDLESQRIHLCAKQSYSDKLEHCYALRGSPLLGVFNDNGKKRFVHYGIKHYGDCTEKLQIYTNVTHKMEWIREVVNRKEELKDY